MHTSTLVALAATIMTASAGTAHVISLCNFPVYVFPVDADRNPTSPVATLNSGGQYSEGYVVPTAGGVSIKISSSATSLASILQLEYTSATPSIFYDGSNINCSGDSCPFFTEGVFMKTSEAATATTCLQVSCPVNQECNGFYNQPNDVKTISCDLSADIFLYLCTLDGTTPSTGGAASSSAAPGASSSVAATAPAATSAAPATQTTPAATTAAAATAKHHQVVTERLFAGRFAYAA